MASRMPALRALAISLAVGGAVLPIGSGVPANASPGVGGTQLWATRYDGPGHRFDLPNAIATSPDGSMVFATGTSSGSSSGSDYASVAYDAATGTMQWVARYNGPGNGRDTAYSVTVGPDGSRVFVTGSSPGTSGYDYGTVAYDAATGSMLWVARYDGPSHLFDEAIAVSVSPDGSK